MAKDGDIIETMLGWIFGFFGWILGLFVKLIMAAIGGLYNLAAGFLQKRKVQLYRSKDYQLGIHNSNSQC